jgi:hypothetical protein
VFVVKYSAANALITKYPVSSFGPIQLVLFVIVVVVVHSCWPIFNDLLSSLKETFELVRFVIRLLAKWKQAT